MTPDVHETAKTVETTELDPWRAPGYQRAIDILRDIGGDPDAWPTVAANYLDVARSHGHALRHERRGFEIGATDA